MVPVYHVPMHGTITEKIYVSRNLPLPGEGASDSPILCAAAPNSTTEHLNSRHQNVKEVTLIVAIERQDAVKHNFSPPRPVEKKRVH